MQPHSTHTNKFSNTLLPNQMDHLNTNQSQVPTQRKLLKPPTPPPKSCNYQILRPKPTHYQRSIDLPGYYPPPQASQENGLPYLTNGPPIPPHENYLQTNFLTQQQTRRRLPYADPNGIDSLYMTTTPNGLVNYQPQEIRNSFAQPVANGMQQMQKNLMQRGIPPQGPYLNVPYPPRQQVQNHNLMTNGNNVNLPNHQPAGVIDLAANRDQCSSAFEPYELYRSNKPSNVNNQQPGQFQTKNSAILNGHQPSMITNSYYLPSPPPIHQSNNLNDLSYRHSSLSTESQTQNVISTVTGTFDQKGGILKCKETGVCIIIPYGALSERQEIYFKVCQDSNMLPLDKEKGETLLSHIAMCGPHGIKFNRPVELRLPYRANVDPDDGSKEWHNTNLNIKSNQKSASNKIDKNYVSILVDHF